MEMKYYNPSNNFKAPIPREPKPYSPPSYNKAEILVPRPVQMPYEKKADKREHSRETILEENGRDQEASFASRKSLDNYAGKEKIKQGSMNRDDWLLLGVIVVLLFNGCDDYILLAVLGYLVFSFRQEDAKDGRPCNKL